ncbi:hypothetical protein XAP412_470020 [Xanthomonas phaseoli pv. phaseoli]|nr:hypothetical protein XAP412_470020 [Xanthomonas phaseoli pv. phaseoli]
MSCLALTSGCAVLLPVGVLSDCSLMMCFYRFCCRVSARGFVSTLTPTPLPQERGFGALLGIERLACPCV